MTEAIVGLEAAITLFTVIVAVLYLFLPFALFGIKPKLDKIIEQQKEALEFMREQATRKKATPPAKPPTDAAAHPPSAS